MLNSTFIDCCAFHTNQEVVLVVDEEDEHVLAQPIIYGRHVVLWMREESRLEDGSQV